MDLKEGLQIFLEGIRDYLFAQSRPYNHRGRLWITPTGPYKTLNEIEKDTGEYRKTLLRRFYSTNRRFQDWYIIDADSELFPAEQCEYCDEIDDMIFLEDEKNWLHRVHHTHGEPITGDTVFEYLHNGSMYKTTVQAWKDNVRLHKPKGE